MQKQYKVYVIGGVIKKLECCCCFLIFSATRVGGSGLKIFNHPPTVE